MSFQAPARESGLKEYPFRRRHIWDRIDVRIGENYEHPLAGIFLPIRMLDIVKEPTAFNSSDNVFETYPSLSIGLELAILLGAPGDRPHSEIVWTE